MGPTGRAANVPVNKMDAGMDRGAERHVVVYDSVAINERLDGPDRTIGVIEILLLVEIANHLSEIVGSATDLSELPVNDDELISVFAMLRCRFH